MAALHPSRGEPPVADRRAPGHSRRGGPQGAAHAPSRDRPRHAQEHGRRGARRCRLDARVAEPDRDPRPRRVGMAVRGVPPGPGRSDRGQAAAGWLNPRMAPAADGGSGTGAYARSGVSQAAAGDAVAALVKSLERIDTGKPSRVVPLPGHYASVLRLDDRTGLALSTDTVGTKMVVAEGRSEERRVGKECVAMN